MPTDPLRPRTRRAILAGAAGGAAALALEAVRPGAASAVNGNLILGSSANTSNAGTLLTNSAAGPGLAISTSVAGGTALEATVSAAGGNAILATSVSGTCFMANVEAPESSAVVGNATAPTGETYGIVGQAFSPDGKAVMGWNVASGTALVGYAGTTDFTVPSRPNTGVLGIAIEGGADERGVVGQVTKGQGVRGEATEGTAAFFRSETGRAVVASVGNPSRVALQTDGGLRFTNRAGRATIAKGRSSVVVSAPGVVVSNFAIATLASDRPGVMVRAAICANGSVKILLSKAVTRATRVAWLVLG